MTATAERITMHPFERANLGVGPFRCVGMSQRRTPAGQPAGTCAYCGTGILYCFRIRDAFGKEFVVGSDCVLKEMVGVDGGLTREIRRMKLEHERKARAEKREAEWARIVERSRAARALLAADATLFAGQPHPNDWYASQGKTYRDYLDYMLGSGATGRAMACREIERATEAR